MVDSMYTIKFSNWEITEDRAIIYCSAYYDGVKIITVPGVMTKEEFDEADPKLVKSMFDNLKQVAEFGADQKLGLA